MKTNFLSIIIILIFINLTINETYGQNYTDLTGATGTTTGNGITIDTNNNMYVVGGIFPDNNSLEFVPGFQPSVPNSISDSSMAYITKHEVNGFSAVKSAFITIDTLPIKPDGSGCGTSTNPNQYVVADKVVVATDNRIYVLGEFRGCDLVLYDNSSTPTLFTNSTYSGFTNQKVFLAVFDSNFTPIACHILCTENQNDCFATDVARATDLNTSQVKVYVSADFSTDFIYVESFGAASPPFSTATSTQNAVGYDILVAQFDVSNEQYEDAVTLGGIGDDHSSELSSGYLGIYGADDLYLTGSFESTITFNNSNNGNTLHTSAGNFDLFALKFPAFDLTTQDACVAGGPWNDQALSMTDNGQFVGGFVSEGAFFDTNGVIYIVPPGNFPLSPYVGYSPGNRREQAFFGQPNYATGDWITVDTIIDDTFDSQMNSMASAICGDFIASYTRGMHPTVMGSPHRPFFNLHLFAASQGTSLDHIYYSYLMKYVHSGSVVEHIWTDSLFPTAPPFWQPAGRINARHIEDIEFNIKGDGDPLIPADVGPGSADLVFTGRFGNNIQLPNFANNSMMTFDGNALTPYLHGNCGMFLGGMHEIGALGWDTIEVCRTDTVTLPVVFNPQLPPAVIAMIDTNTLYYTGDGILDSVNRIFTPTTYGGFHHIQGHYNYFGCLVSSLALVIKVVDDPFPLQPLTTDPNMSEGLAVEAATMVPGGDADGLSDYNYYYNAGFYQDTIRFEKHNGDYITLTSNTGIQSGYVVCYDPCGAVWATNFRSSGVGGYVENIVMGSNNDLYVCGGFDGPVDIINSKQRPSPSTAINNASITLNTTNFADKGFVARLNAITGQVTWVYLGGDNSTERNQFHGLAIDSIYLAVIGEFRGNITGQFGGSTTSFNSTGQYDVFYMYMDTTGSTYEASYFGTANNDHGDAIDFAYNLEPGAAPEDKEMAYTGFVHSGSGAGNTISHNFNSVSTSTLTGGNGTEIFVGRSKTIPSTSSLIDVYLKIYEGPENDQALDIVYTEPTAHAFYPNDLMVCGRFKDSIYIPGISTGYATLNNNEFDGFVMSLNSALNDNWFSPEGSGIYSDESVDALVMRTNSVFATGKYQGAPSSTLLNGLPNVQSRYGLFTSRFSAAGVLLSNDAAIPSGTGQNGSSDICVIDTSLLSTGHIGVGMAVDVAFNNSVYPNTNNHEVFIARSDRITSAYFKNDNGEKEEVEEFTTAFTLHPNPNSGSFVVKSIEPHSGDLYVYDLKGQLLYSKAFQKTQHIEVQTSLSSGAYIVMIHAENASFNIPMIITR